MSTNVLEQHIALLDRHVERCRLIVHRQNLLVAWLEHERLPVDAARDTLDIYERVLALHVFELERLQRQMERLREQKGIPKWEVLEKVRIAARGLGGRVEPC